MTKEKMRACIRRALAYNDKARRMASCNSLYMGSMATARLMGIFGLAYGKPGLGEAINRADSATLATAVEYCRIYWEAAEEKNAR